jgi:hypothetical protein
MFLEELKQWEFGSSPESRRLWEERIDRWTLLLHRGLYHGKEPDSCAEEILTTPSGQSLHKKEVEGASSIHKHSIELNVLHDGADYQGIPPQLWYKVWVVATVKGNGDLRLSKVLGVAGLTAMTSRAVSFFFLLVSYESGPPKI